mmetsp:Transcript_118648/g.295888  ORF Transcript_118648/g.295888 Transcript_118648/m.295888 type:complete len:115 (+) Transcript_118648:517-861(+)
MAAGPRTAASALCAALAGDRARHSFGVASGVTPFSSLAKTAIAWRAPPKGVGVEQWRTTHVRWVATVIARPAARTICKCFGIEIGNVKLAQHASFPSMHLATTVHASTQQALHG